MPEHRIQLVVDYLGHATRYYQVPPGQGWRVDTDMRCIVVGQGLPRTLVPLDRVLSVTVEVLPNAG